MADGKILRDLLTAISTIVDEATFDIDDNSIKLRAMDPSRVAMVDFLLEKNVFEEFISSENFKMCVNLTEFLKLIKRGGKDETIELFLDDETNLLQITIRGNYTRTFKMPTLDISEEEVPTPKISFNVEAILTTEGFRHSLEDVSLVSDHVRLETDDKKVIMNAKGDLMGANIELQKDSEALLSLNVKEPAKATFSLIYLMDIVKSASPTSEIVKVEYSTDMPIRLDFKQNVEGKLIYYLAPRIEVD